MPLLERTYNYEITNMLVLRNDLYFLSPAVPLTEITIVTPEPLEGYTKTYTVGQKLNCTAQGNPNPTFNWRRESSTMAQILSAVLTLDNNMMGANNWICEAQQFGSGVDNKKVARISFDVKRESCDIIIIIN